VPLRQFPEQTLCDNTHLETKFSDPGGLDVQVGGSGKPQDEKGELKVRSAPNGPLLLQGPLTIESADGVDRKDPHDVRCVDVASHRTNPSAMGLTARSISRLLSPPSAGGS